MKTLTLSLLVAIFIFGNANSQCTPDTTIAEWGIYPSSDSLPCIERGVPYATVMQFKVFDFAEFDSALNAVFPGFGFQLDSLRLDSVANLPAGINYQIGKRLYFSNETGCIDLFGITTDPIGSYNIEVYVTMFFPPIGGQSMTLSGLYQSPYDTIMPGNNILPRFVSVINLGDSCGVTAEPKNVISGSVFYDVNANGLFDSTDAPMSNQQVSVSPNPILSYTDAAGEYHIFVDSGSYTVSLQAPLNFVLTSPGSHSVFVNGSGQHITENNFGLSPAVIVEDVEITLTSTQARPGFQTTHWINYQNIGTTLASGTLTYQHDPVLSLVSSTVPATTQVANELTWNYSNLYPGEQRTIQLTLQIPPDNNLRGDTLISFALITPVEDPRTNANNKYTIGQEVTGSYDPNDKLVEPGNKFEILPDQTLTYTIRFQNTGTDTAFTVVIRDTLDSHLDISTFKTIATSHPASCQLEGNKYAIWTFNNVLLPDSFVNETASHGFVKFSVLPKANIEDQTLLTNSASIYFDFNDPVRTNTTVVKVDFTSGIKDLSGTNASVVFPNPSKGEFTISLKDRMENFAVGVYDMLGNQLQWTENNSGERASVDLNGFPEGVYFYRVFHRSAAVSTGKMVVLR